MGSERDGVDTPNDGTPIEYESGFRSPEHPLVPVVFGDGAGGAVVSAARRVLDTAAETTGRDIQWVRLRAGDAAREADGTALPYETVETLRELRVGLVGPLRTREERPARDVYGKLCRQLGLYANVRPADCLEWAPTPTTADGTGLVLFQEATEDVAANIGFEPGTEPTRRIRRFLGNEPGCEGAVHDGPAGFGVRPVTEFATHRLVETAVDYALDNDRDTVTIVHQANVTPATEASFREWALTHIRTEYAGAVVTEERFHGEYGGTYPDDELVVGTRRTDEVCRGLVSDPGAYDVLVAPALGGEYVSAVATEMIGGPGVAPGATVGDGRILAHPGHGSTVGNASDGEANPIATILSGCLLFEYIGWDDASAMIRDAVEATLAGGLLPRDLCRHAVRGTPVTTGAFTDRVVEHLDGTRERSPTATVRTTPDERMAIKGMIVTLYNTVFDDHISEQDVELNQLRGEDEEAEIYLPEVGINFSYWRRWSVERRLEVLLHELAHVENYDDDHSPSFYDRFVELTGIAEDWRPELEAAFGEPIDFELVKRYIVESVHEETIETDTETVADRQRQLCDTFDLRDSDHY